MQKEILKLDTRLNSLMSINIGMLTQDQITALNETMEDLISKIETLKLKWDKLIHADSYKKVVSR